MYPTLLHFGHLYLPTFGVLAAVGLMLALALSERTARLVGIDPERLWNAGIFAILAAFLLSRLLLIATNFRTFLAYPIVLLAVPSLTATGLLLTLIATAAWLHFKRVPLLRALDAWAPCAALVWAFLAAGHFAEGSDPGMPSTLPWAIPAPGMSFRIHPVALYAFAAAILIAFAAYNRLRRLPHPGQTAALTLVSAGLVQFLLSFLREPGITSLAGLDLLQCVSLAMLSAGILLAARTPPQSQRQ